MALLSVIRRWHLRDGHSIREIARRTGLSRNTIRKYLRSDEVEPRFQVPERPSKLDAYAERLSAWLRTEANRPRKQKRTIKQLHADLMSLGYEGSYGRVAAFARAWKEARQRQMQTSGRGTSHYLFETEFCNPASGWEKGQVEKNVQDARHRLWQPMPRFPSLEALNDWLEQRCRELWQQIPHGLRPGTIEDIRAEEARFLMPMPRLFDGFVEYTKRVSPTCLVHLERNRYSVPASFANRPVSLWVYPERIVVAAEGQLICEHRRIIERSHDRLGQTIYDWRHYLAVLQRKPGALRNGAPFTELPDAFKRLQQHLLRKPGGDREMVEIHWPLSCNMTSRPC
jgi:transposase